MLHFTDHVIQSDLTLTFDFFLLASKNKISFVVHSSDFELTKKEFLEFLRKIGKVIYFFNDNLSVRSVKKEDTLFRDYFLGEKEEDF